MNFVIAGLVGAAMAALVGALLQVSMRKFHVMVIVGAIIMVALELIGIQFGQAISELLASST